MIAATGCIILSGCQTLNNAEWTTDPSSPDLPPGGIIEISEDDRAFSKALAHFSRGHLHELNQEYDAALAQYRLALTYDPDHQDTYLRVALNLIRRDRTDEAIDILRQLSDRKPDSAQPLIWLGSAHRHNRGMDAAITAYQKALERAPDNAGIYIQLVDLYIQQGAEQDAMDLLSLGTRKADEPKDLYRVLGELYMRHAALSTDVDDSRHYMDKAIHTYKEALELDPRDATLLSTLGDLYLRDRQFEQAIEVFERVESLYPDDIAVKERLAYTYELAGQLEDAVRVLEEMTVTQPTNARLFFALGAMYERLEQDDHAILNYQLAARLDRSDPAAYLKLAVLHMEDDPDAAMAALRDGLTFMPDNPRMLEMQGYVLFNKQDYPKAIKSFRQAEEEWILEDVDAMTPNFYLYLALSYYFDDQPDEVSDVLWEAMDRNPDALEAFAHFIFQDDDEDRIGKAVSIFNALREKSPDDAALLTMLAYVHSFRKEYARALDIFDEVKGLAAGTEDEELILNPRFYFWYAAAHEREDMHERAEELFYKCLELDPQNAEAYNYLAYMWAEKGINLEKAKEYVLIALDQRPDSGAFIDTLGWIYYQQGRYEEAYKEIKRAADIIPDDPTILDHLGDIYLKLDEPEKAMAKWQRSFVIDPDNEEVSQKLTEYGVDLEPLKAKAKREQEDQEEAVTEPPALDDEDVQESAPTEDAENEEDAAAFIK